MSMFQNRLFRVIAAFLPAVLFVVLLYSHEQSSPAVAPAAVGGVLDLKGWDPQKNSHLQLAGEWDFYPQQLLTKNDIDKGHGSSVLVKLPFSDYIEDIQGSSWDEYEQATYRIQIRNAPANSQLAIQVRHLTAAYRLYMDDELIAAHGQLTDDFRAPIADYRHQTAYLNPPDDNFDVILQVANQYDTLGLLQWPVILGSYQAISRYSSLVNIVNYLTMGSLLTLCLLLLMLWVILPRERIIPILILLGILILVRVMIFEEVFLTDLWPHMTLLTENQLHYLTVAGIQLLLPLLVAAFIPSLVPRWLGWLVTIYAVALGVITMIIPMAVFSYVSLILDGTIALIIIALIILLTQAVWAGLSGSLVLLMVLAWTQACASYSLFSSDISLTYYLLNGSGIPFIVFFLALCGMLAVRFKESQSQQLNALKGQMRPHFVHNALATIISISRQNPDHARDLLINFSDYLRGSFDFTNNDLIAFQQELDLVKAYVSLENARFGGKFVLDYHIEVDNFLMPPLLLQPLVENALIHGLRYMKEGGTVVVYTQRRNRKIRIGVRDNGIGLNLGLSDVETRQGVALRNINRRLANLYHSQLHFRTPPGGGCEVYLEIPYMEAAAYENYSG